MAAQSLQRTRVDHFARDTLVGLEEGRQDDLRALESLQRRFEQPVVLGAGVCAEVDVDKHAAGLCRGDHFQQARVIATWPRPLPQVGQAARVDADEHDVGWNFSLQQPGARVRNPMLERR